MPAVYTLSASLATHLRDCTVASERARVLVHSFAQLKREYPFCHKGKMDKIQWRGRPAKLMRNLYAVPLALGDEVEGVLKVENREGEGSFTAEDVATVDALAQLVSLVAKPLVLVDSHERRLIDAPARLSRALLRPFDTQQLTREIVATTAETLNAEVCSLWLVDATGTRLVHQANFGFKGRESEVPEYPIDIEAGNDSEIPGITAWVAIRRRPFWANSHDELRKHPSWRGNWDPVQFGGRPEARERFRSMYAVPLIWNEDLLGVLKVENPTGAAYFSSTDRLKCDLMASYVVLLLALTRQARLQLVPGMAHILNSPAAGIAMLVEELDRELLKASPDLERLRDYVNLVRRWTLSIATMSRTLSAEVEARVGTQQVREVDLIAFLRTQLGKIRPLVPRGTRVEMVSELASSLLPLTRSEEIWLEIILFNLLHNALKHGPEGEVITLDCARSAGDMVLAVSDRGPGIAPEDRPHIFEAGFRNPGASAGSWPAGIGLGLYEVRRLVGQLKWSINVSDNRPQGARFEIRIPQGWRRSRDAPT